MAFHFQNLLLSYLPMQASTAFVERTLATDPRFDLASTLRKKTCEMMTSETLGRDDFAGVQYETALCMNTNACIACFDFVLVMAEPCPLYQTSAVLRSLKPRGVACLLVYVEAREQALWYRALIDGLCACMPEKLTTMDVWFMAQNTWVVPVFRMD